MVTRAVGGDALGRLLLGKAEHRVAGAARLEGTRFLEVLALEEQLGAGAIVEIAAGQHRCAVDIWPDALVGGYDVLISGYVHKSTFQKNN